MDIKEIQELIKFVSKSGVSEVELESKGFKITIKTPPYKRGGQPEVQIVQAAPVAAQPVAPAPTAASQPVAETAPAKTEPAEDNGN